MTEDDTFRKLKKIPFWDMMDKYTDGPCPNNEDWKIYNEKYGWTEEEFIAEMRNLGLEGIKDLE
jgi:hypothetical protein